MRKRERERSSIHSCTGPFSQRIEDVALIHVSNLIRGFDHCFPVGVYPHNAHASVLHVEAAETRGVQACVERGHHAAGHADGSVTSKNVHKSVPFNHEDSMDERSTRWTNVLVGEMRLFSVHARQVSPRLVDRSALIIDLWLTMRISVYLSSVMMRSQASFAFT